MKVVLKVYGSLEELFYRLISCFEYDPSVCKYSPDVLGKAYACATSKLFVQSLVLVGPEINHNSLTFPHCLFLFHNILLSSTNVEDKLVLAM